MPSDPTGPAPDPVLFVVGMGRSGTTLLRAMLSARDDLAIPPETHVVPHLLRAGEPVDPDRFAATAAATGFLPKWNLDADELARLVRHHRCTTAPDAIRRMYQHYAATQGKPRSAEKTPNYIASIDQLAASFPTSVFVHLVRDPRAVAQSFRDVGFEARPGVTAIRWTRVVDRWDAACRSALAPRCLEIRYEDLVTQPDATLRQVCDHAGLDWDDGALHFAEHADAVLHGVDRPAIHSRLRQDLHLEHRWTTELAPVEIAGIEQTAGARLADRHYDAVAPDVSTTATRLRDRVEWAARQGRQRVRRHRRGYTAAP